MAPVILTSSPAVCRNSVGAREFTSATDLLANYRAVHARLWSPPIPKAPASSPASTIAAPDPVGAKAWDEEVYAVLDRRKMEMTPRRIIARVAAKHGLRPQDITGPGRTKEIYAARLKAIDLVVEEHPNLSTPELGRHFGGRDHTTMLHALRRLGRLELSYWGA